MRFIRFEYVEATVPIFKGKALDFSFWSPRAAWVDWGFEVLDWKGLDLGAGLLGRVGLLGPITSTWHPKAIWADLGH